MSLLLLLAGGPGGAPTLDPTFPDVTVEITFGYTWRDENPVFTDVSQHVDFVQGISINEGRADELQPFDASTCSFRLDNRARTYDPTYEPGPWFGLLDPVVPVRVTATLTTPGTGGIPGSPGAYPGAGTFPPVIPGDPGSSGAGSSTTTVTYPLFYGFIEGFPQESTIGNRTSWQQIVANDSLELFAQADYTGGSWTLDDPDLGRLDSGNRVGGGTLAVSGSGERVTTILDLTGYPTSLRSVAAGVAEVSTDLLDGTPRSALQAVELAEGGWLYQDREGKVVFLPRHAERSVTRMATSQVTFTDANTSRPYSGLRFSWDRRFVYNDIRREREGGVVQVAADEASRRRFFRRKHELSGMILTNDLETRALAQLFGLRYALPQLRAEPLTIDPGNDPAGLYPQVLGRQLLDRITLVRTPQEVGNPINVDFRIEGVNHQIGAFSWSAAWALSPVDTRTYLTLDDDALGLLDSGNLIGA